ncbi:MULTISPECIES: glucosaminidase domain-containing protein [Olivibacter]|jgi:flagellum-specific peptidoglycan hydrolase FlgJ|uniref:Peptidoglycan hydrolase n=2 Tax=Olivibacter TaxID=376469 RepID=A0ABV6HD95_9SPHI|nr:glucosaminidase domain-containing protein [Olivibacter sp. 47]MDM8178052.1 glucosaminidase domain-containing protein [Olivibacter sp. 47]MDX3916428.1 glucosaminidase domain-containing protein [Pseudosphingobacterium sp.]QEK99355.1 LysM peptidoglycan-binding domain-containing protein [Olivibacter sp. LS-1]
MNKQLQHIALPSFVYLILFFCISLSLTSCLPKQKVLQSSKTRQQGSYGSNNEGRRHNHPHRPSNKPAAISASAQDYISRYKTIAIQEMNTYGIPASITLAQGLLESANGNSTLAREANNHFGIKCTPDWKGESFFKDDDAINDCFRVYRSPEDSFRDHSEFLLRKRYAPLFELDKDDYTGWAKGLKKAGYATNPRYAELLIDLIERYGLYEYDRGEKAPEKINREERVLVEIADNSPKEPEKAEAKPPVEMKIHEVRQGDTIYSISKRYGLTTDELKNLNSLDSDDLVVGQLLLVSK